MATQLSGTNQHPFSKPQTARSNVCEFTETGSQVAALTQNGCRLSARSLLVGGMAAPNKGAMARPLTLTNISWPHDTADCMLMVHMEYNQ